MQGSHKHSMLKGILIMLKAWSWRTLHGHPYKARHKVHGRPDGYKHKDRASVRRPAEQEEELA